MSSLQGNIMTQDFLFKDDNAGISKKSGKAYRILTLHDPKTLDNVDFFLDGDCTISTEGFQIKDKVKAAFTMELRFGKLQPVIVQLTKVA